VHKLPSAAKLDALDPDALQQFKREARFPMGVAAAAGSYLVAEGDSWFDYPIGTDIIDCLRAYHGYSISNYAKAGDTIENMAYGTNFSPLQNYRPLPNDTQDVLADITTNEPAAFLLSGGGNDVAGNEFGQFLNHASSGKPLFRQDFAEYMINTVFRTAYSDLIDQVSAARPGITIVSHGYGYPIPDGRGVGFGVGISFIGPWLRPALAAKRINSASDGPEIIENLMNMFNEMLDGLRHDHPNFRYIDLRRTIGRSQGAWANELHVKNSIYKVIADKFHEAIQSGGPGFTPASIKPARSRKKKGPSVRSSVRTSPTKSRRRAT